MGDINEGVGAAALSDDRLSRRIGGGAIPDNPRWFVVTYAFERDEVDVVTR